jgi:putative aldouronate transport system permease protein
MKQKYSVFDFCNGVIMLIVFIVCVYPILNVLALSLSDSSAVVSGSITFFPKDITFQAYKNVLVQSRFWIGYKNTIIYTVFSTLLGLIGCTITAYPLSKKKLPGRKFFIGMITFTMFFSGGMIPNYLLIRKLGLTNTIFSIILPGAIQAYYVILIRNFFEGIPESLEDSASIDGLNDIGILLWIYLPLSKAVLATIGLFYAVSAWNSWFSALIYLNDQNKYPVMIFLRNIVNGAVLAENNPDLLETIPVVSPSLRSATIISVILPIICVYPFVQKYFVKGVMIGAVKG